MRGDSGGRGEMLWSELVRSAWNRDIDAMQFGAVQQDTAYRHRRGCETPGAHRDELADCDDVSERSGAPFVCAYVDETTEDGNVTGHTCVPASEADAAAGGGR